MSARGQRIGTALTSPTRVWEAAVTEQNKANAARLNEVFVTGDTDALNEFVAEDVVDHNPQPGQAPGRDALVEAVRLYHVWFSDLEITIEEAAAENDVVAITGVVSGTNTGELMGRPATGKRVTFSYSDMFRIADGQIREA